MHLISNEDVMRGDLAKFGVEYRSPCYISINDCSGFLASNAGIRPGFAAYTDDGYLLIYIDGITGAAQIAITSDNVTSLDIKNLPLLPEHSIKIKGIQDGNKFYYKLLLPHKSGKSFPSQKENTADLISFLEYWK